jgi:hypothetical protein
VLEQELSGPLEEDVDHDALGRRDHHVLHELLVLVTFTARRASWE